MGNAKGSYATTPQLTMQAFDKLPPTARRALANAAICWATQPILTYWRRGYKGYKTGAEIAAKVAAWDNGWHRKDARRGIVAPLAGGEPLTPERIKS